MQILIYPEEKEIYTTEKYIDNCKLYSKLCELFDDVDMLKYEFPYRYMKDKSFLIKSNWKVETVTILPFITSI
jgi:hypothetical protein